MKTFIDYLKDENGQTSTEYILLVAVVALIVMKFKNIATEKLEGLTGQIFDAGGEIATQISTEATN